MDVNYVILLEYKARGLYWECKSHSLAVCWVDSPFEVFIASYRLGKLYQGCVTS